MVQRRRKNPKKQDNWIEPGSRIMDIAYLRDGHDIIHTGEALMLACLVHAKGRTKRGEKELADVAKMLDDPNRPNRRRKR